VGIKILIGASICIIGAGFDETSLVSTVAQRDVRYNCHKVTLCVGKQRMNNHILTSSKCYIHYLVTVKIKFVISLRGINANRNFFQIFIVISNLNYVQMFYEINNMTADALKI